jgi:hypothetical protein
MTLQDHGREMGHSHAHRPFVSRREFLRRSALVGAGVAAGPWFWRQLAYAADAPIRLAHLTFGRDAGREMTVSWMTPEPVKEPFVQLAGHRFAAQTVQYDGYPGWFHHARADELTPSSSYAYRIGHDGALRAPAQAFTTAPAAGERFTFTAFGDQGVDGASGQSVNQPSANTELAASFNPAFHLIVGDLAYANGDQAIWDDWFSMIEPMARTTPWMPLIGNHEIESQLDATHTGSGWGEWGYDPYRSRFALPSNGHDELANCFYSFRYGGVHFLCLDNNDVNEEVTNNIGYTTDRQKAWVEAELAAARLDPDVDFIVVGMHQCAFSSSTKHGSDPGVQRTWFELFHKHSVDLVLQGHDHTYERSHAMVAEQVADQGPVYRSDAGTVYVVCGNGGAVQEPFHPVQPGWSAFRQALKVGTLKIEVDPGAPGGMKRMVHRPVSAWSSASTGRWTARPSRRASSSSVRCQRRRRRNRSPPTTARPSRRRRRRRRRSCRPTPTSCSPRPAVRRAWASLVWRPPASALRFAPSPARNGAPSSRTPDRRFVRVVSLPPWGGSATRAGMGRRSGSTSTPTPSSPRSPTTWSTTVTSTPPSGG